MKKLNIISNNIVNMLESRPDIDIAIDISKTIQQKKIMAFDCKLSEEIFSFEEMEEILEEMEENIDESYFDVAYEDIRAYLKDATDEIEEELQEVYNTDNIRCVFEIYNIDDTFTDFKFVFIISFEDTKISSLTNLSKIIGKRQLSGASKFYM